MAGRFYPVGIQTFEKIRALNMLSIKYMRFICMGIMMALGLFGCGKGKPIADSAPSMTETKLAETPKAEALNADEAEKSAAVPDMPEVQEADAAKTGSAPDEVIPPHEVSRGEAEEWGYFQHAELQVTGPYQIYIEVPILNKSIQNHEKINAVFKKRSDEFFTAKSLSNALGIKKGRDEYQPTADELYYYYYQSRMTQKTNQYISVVLTKRWFFGGVTDIGYETYVFDLNTGNPVSLPEYLNQPLGKVQALIRNKLKAEYKYGDLEWEKFESQKTYKYYLENDKVHVVFNQYEIACGAAGAIEVTL